MSILNSPHKSGNNITHQFSNARMWTYGKQPTQRNMAAFFLNLFLCFYFYYLVKSAFKFPTKFSASSQHLIMHTKMISQVYLAYFSPFTFVCESKKKKTYQNKLFKTRGGDHRAAILLRVGSLSSVHTSSWRTALLCYFQRICDKKFAVSNTRNLCNRFCTFHFGL